MNEYVEFLDTSLRDGNKLPFVVLDRHDRLVIARQLAALGVDIIDAGYPAASAEEGDIVRAIAEEVRGPRISALSRAVVEDVAAVCDLLSSSDRPYVHIFLPMSPSFLSGRLKLSSNEILKRIGQCLEAAAGMPAQFSLGDIAEADEELLGAAAEAAAEAGVAAVNLADTNGSMHPAAAAALVGRMVDRLGGRLTVGVHFHNDLGLATANTLACLEAGARHVECTIGGLGERAGNAALEEVVFGLEAFGERLKLAHHIHLDQLWRTAALLSRLNGIPAHPNKPVLGKCALPNTGRTEAGEAKGLPGSLGRLMRGQTIGRSEDALFGDQQMSRAGFQQQLAAFQLDLEGVNLDKAFGLYQSQLRRKKTVALSEVQSIVEQARLEEGREAYSLASFSVMTGSHCLPVGSVELKKEDGLLVQSATGTGPVDALCRAVDRAVGLTPRLVLYSVDHLTEGKDARAEVTVSLAYMGAHFHGHSGSTDVVEASLRAYLEAVNHIEAHRQAYPREQFYINGEELWWE